jgi:hypothetical protein
VDQAVVSEKRCVTAACLKSLLAFAEQKGYDITDAVKIADAIRPTMPLNILKKLVKFKIRYQTVKHVPITDLFMEIVGVVDPYNLDEGIYSLRAFYAIVNTDVHFAEAQGVAETVWCQLISPLAMIQHRYRTALMDLYRLLRGVDWGGRPMDPAWYQAYEA